MAHWHKHYGAKDRRTNADSARAGLVGLAALAFLVVILLFASLPAGANENTNMNKATCWACSHRSDSAKRAFEFGVKPYDKWPAHPCPYTAAQGCIIDHIKSLKCGGQDSPENMQWQTDADSKKKDRVENLGC